VKVSASILSCDFLHLEEEIRRVEEAGVDMLHLDIMDGQFVPNLSFGTPIVKAIKRITSLPLVSHLMTIRPERVIPYFIQESFMIIFHIEATQDPIQCISLIKRENKKPGIAINPETPISKIEEFIPELSELLLMSVHPGFGGQGFIPEVLKKLEDVKKRYPSLTVGVDGGVNPEIAKELKKRGADIAVAGTAIFKSKDYKERVEGLRG